MAVYVWDHRPEYEKERDDILDAVDTVFRSDQLILGPSVKSFEDEFAAYHGVSHCAGVDNGTNAVKLGLQALGVKAGDEVITVSNTAAPTVLAIDSIGAVPVFVDIEPDTYLMRTDQVADRITDRTTALVPVQLYGQCVDLAPLQELAARHNLKILEDCAQAHGSHGKNGKLAGTTGDAGAFSFYPTKVLGAYGDAGAVITSDDHVDTEMRKLRRYGMETLYYVVQTPGHNARLDELHAEILRRKLRRLDDYIAARRAIAQRYADGLGDTEIVLPKVAEGNDHVYYIYVVRHPERDAILEALKEYDFHFNISYPWPCHTMTGFAHLGWSVGDLPETEKAAKEIFSLPMYPALSEDVQSKIITALREILARG